MVTPDFVMQGAHYALEQCGRLLHDAIRLYQAESYATAKVLAAFAREELGKARELRAIRREVLAGATFTAKEVRNRCAPKHVTKQERGQTSVILKSDSNKSEELGKLISAMSANDPLSPEYQQADARLTEIMDEIRKRAPKERHEARLNNLYVDPDDTGTVWNRPATTTKADAFESVKHAVNDYSVQYQHYQLGNTNGEGKELYDALQQWGDRPDLPQPQWPESVHRAG
jgi:hypothetical protein